MEIAQAIIGGASAVIKTLAQYGATPIGWINAGAVATATLAQLNTIRKQQYQSQASSIEPPNFNTSVDNNTDTNQANGQGFGGSQTYLSPTVSVLEINQTQKRLDDINNIAVIGG